jgi:hypothetical protein
MCSHCTIDQKEFFLEKRDEAHNDQNTLSANAWSGGLATIMTWWTRNSFTEGTQYEAKWWSHHNDLLNRKQYVGRSLMSHHNDLVGKSSLWKNMMGPTMTKMWWFIHIYDLVDRKQSN